VASEKLLSLYNAPQVFSAHLAFKGPNVPYTATECAWCAVKQRSFATAFLADDQSGVRVVRFRTGRSG
jgi:hypothetical protein